MSLTWLQLGLASVSGALVALLLSVFGGGGSVLAVPLLLYLVGVRDPHVHDGHTPIYPTVPSDVGRLLTVATAIFDQMRLSSVARDATG